MSRSPEEWRAYVADTVPKLGRARLVRLMRIAWAVMHQTNRQWIELAFHPMLWRVALAFRHVTGIELNDSEVWWIVNVTLGTDAGAGTAGGL